MYVITVRYDYDSHQQQVQIIQIDISLYPFAPFIILKTNIYILISMW